MKYSRHLIISFCLLLSAFCFLPFASAQRFIGGLAVGMNLTQVDGDEVFGYTKAGFNGGPYVKVMLDKKQRFSLTMELLYSQKGAAKRYPVSSEQKRAYGDTLLFDLGNEKENMRYFYRLRTDYLEIPLLVHYDDPRSKISVGIGLSWARLVRVNELQYDFRKLALDTVINNLKGSRQLNTTVNSGRYYKNDWSIIADVKIPIYKGLKFNFRFQYSLVPFGQPREFFNRFGKSVGTRKPYHNTLTFRIIYSFNEKYTENHNFDRDGKRIGPRWIRDPEAMKW